MKKIYILMIAVLLGGIAKGQINWNYDTIITYDRYDNINARYTQTFNNDGKILTKKHQLYELTTNDWENIGKFIYTYNANGDIISELYTSWEINSWANKSKYTYTYDSAGNNNTRLLTYLQYNTWINNEKITYTYNSNNKIYSRLRESWNTNQNCWENTGIQYYLYDSSNNIDTTVSYIWQNNAWLNSYRGIYSYSSTGKIINETREIWDNHWVLIGKYFKTYDMYDNLITQLNEIATSNGWTNDSRYSYSYNLNGDMLTLIEEKWINGWIYLDKQTYSYDPFGNSITGKHEEWENNNWSLSSDNLRILTYTNNIRDFIPAITYKAHFVSFTNGINETTPKQLNLYPNPATNTLTLNLSQLQGLQNATVSIYDIQGKQMLQQSITEAQTQIDISSFAKGIYIVKLQTDKEILQSKFIKE